MRIVFATSEVHPFSKTGGLADVAGSLPAALVRLGHEVLVVSPWYATLAGAPLPAPLWIGDVDVPFDGGFEPVGVGTLGRDGVRYAFVGHAAFRRARLYGYPDDVRRFCLLTRAVPQVAERVGFEPDLVHANDWHTAYLPLVLRDGWHLPPGWPGLGSVFTVHNVEYQGESDLAETVWWLRLPSSAADDYMQHFGRANAMQAGLGHATRVTTVSPTYALEVQRPAFGYGLDGTFRHIGARFSGILNGIDTVQWDPATDPLLPRRYSVSSPSGKAEVKAALRRRLGLDGDRPVLGVVSRFADQKGLDVLMAAGEGLLAQGWSLALLGSGDPDIEASARALQAANPGRVSGEIGFDEPLAHLIYGGADALAVPSRFEPCGLSQMIAMRYGTLPIVRDTGGLHDTVADGVTGFVFELAEPGSLLEASARALNAYGTPGWDAMMVRAMLEDFGWERSAGAYVALYAQVLDEQRAGPKPGPSVA